MRENALGGVLVLLSVVVGVEGVRGELKGNGTTMKIRFSSEQLRMVPLHRLIVPRLDHIDILPGLSQYDTR